MCHPKLGKLQVNCFLFPVLLIGLISGSAVFASFAARVPSQRQRVTRSTRLEFDRAVDPEHQIPHDIRDATADGWFAADGGLQAVLAAPPAALALPEPFPGRPLLAKSAPSESQTVPVTPARGPPAVF